MKIDYLLTGLIDGQYTEIGGTGETKSSGGFNLELDVRYAAAGWDPAVIVLMCCDNLRLFTANCARMADIVALQDGMQHLRFGESSTFDRYGQFEDDEGNIAAFMKAKGFLFVENDTAFSRTVVTNGSSKALASLGGIACILTPYEENITPTTAGRAVGLSKYSVICGNGATLHGYSQYPYVFQPGSALNNSIVLTVSRAETNSLEYHASGAKPLIDLDISGSYAGKISRKLKAVA